MSHQWMRCNLASAQFPFQKDLWGRSIILPQYDQNYDRTTQTVAADVDKDKGVPQAYYMHNCLPTAQGYQAIAYNRVISPLVGTTDFDAAFTLQNPAQKRFLFVPAVGKNYVYDTDIGNWASVSPFPPGTLPATVIVTTAFIQAQTYIFYSGVGAYYYDSVTKLMVNAPLVGLTINLIKGICAANGYMIAISDTDVAWSSATNPLDFVPSVITGAGGGSVAEAKGKIITCLPISGGFILYCEKNAVSAKFTGNARFPYIFTEIPGSGGITSPEQVSWQANLAEHYAWTNMGLQKITLTATANIFPEITDFLAALIFEDFNEATLLFTEQYLSTPLSIKLGVIGNRYAVISYGTNFPDFTHALVFDLALKRWGKLKVNHRDCFQLSVPTLYGPVTYGNLTQTYGDFGTTVTYGDLGVIINVPDAPKKTLAFLQQDGTVQLVNFNLSETDANGVLMVGKFQFQRNKFITHQQTDIENVRSTGIFGMYVVASLDGKTLLLPIAGILQYLNPLSRRYNKRLSGLNISLLFIGGFNLTSLLFNYTVGGDR